MHSSNSLSFQNHDPFGYLRQQFPFGAPIPGHHFYIQHPYAPPFVPGFVVYPNEKPTEYSDVDQTESNGDGEPTENPDAESVTIDNAVDVDGTKEETTPDNVDYTSDNVDDSVLVEAYQFDGDN